LKLPAAIYEGHASWDGLEVTDRRLRLMMELAPKFSTFNSDARPRLAWPTALIKNSDGHAVGFSMPYLDRSQTIEGYRLFCPDQLDLGFSRHYRARVDYLCSLAEIIAALHGGGVAVWDLKPENLRGWRVGATRRICLLDCDSFVLGDATGSIDPGPGGFTAGYASPEAMATPQAPDLDTAKSQDLFAFAVIAFQALTGVHPYDGILPDPVEDEGRQWRIGNRLYPWSDRAGGRIRPPRGVLFPRFLPTETLLLFEQAFLGSSRPSAKEWFEHLQALMEHAAQTTAVRICDLPGHLPMQGVCIACLSAPGAIYESLRKRSFNLGGGLRRDAAELGAVAKNFGAAWLRLTDTGRRLSSHQAELFSQAAALDRARQALNDRDLQLQAAARELDHTRQQWMQDRILAPLRMAIALQDAANAHAQLDLGREREIAALWAECLRLSIGPELVGDEMAIRAELAARRTQAVAAFQAAATSGDLSAAADALDAADIQMFSQAPGLGGTFAAKAAAYRQARAVLLTHARATVLDAVAVAEIFDSSPELAESEASIETTARGVESLRDLASAAGEWRALASHLLELRARDGEPNALTDEAREAEIKTTVARMAALGFRLPEGSEMRATLARKRVASAARFRDALREGNDAALAELWQKRPGVAELRDFRNEKTEARAQLAMSAAAEAEKLMPLCCADPANEADVAEAWSSAKALQQSSIAVSLKIGKQSLRDRAELAVARRDALARVRAAIPADCDLWNPIAESALLAAWDVDAELLKASGWCLMQLQDRLDRARLRAAAWEAVQRHRASEDGPPAKHAEWLQHDELTTVNDDVVRSAAIEAAPLRDLFRRLAATPADDLAALGLWDTLPSNLRAITEGWSRPGSDLSVEDEIQRARQRSDALHQLREAAARAEARVRGGVHDPDAERTLAEAVSKARNLGILADHDPVWGRGAKAQALTSAWDALQSACENSDPVAAELAIRGILGRHDQDAGASGLPLSQEHLALISLGQWLVGRGRELHRQRPGTAESDAILCELASLSTVRSLDAWWAHMRPTGAPATLADAIRKAEARQGARRQIAEAASLPPANRVRAAFAFDEAEWVDTTEKRSLRARIQKAFDPVRRWRDFRSALEKDPIAALAGWDEKAFSPLFQWRSEEIARVRKRVAEALQSLAVNVDFQGGGPASKGPTKVLLTCRQALPPGASFSMCAADIEPPRRRFVPAQMVRLTREKVSNRWQGNVPVQPRRAAISIWASFEIGGEEVTHSDPLWRGLEPYRYRVYLKSGGGILSKLFGSKPELEVRAEAAGSYNLPPLSLDCVAEGRPRQKIMYLTAEILKTARDKGSCVLDYDSVDEWKSLKNEGYAPRFALSLLNPDDAAWVEVDRSDVKL
jgi:hypothetical protein